jgi:hypothetical protein
MIIRIRQKALQNALLGRSNRQLFRYFDFRACGGRGGPRTRPYGNAGPQKDGLLRLYERLQFGVDLVGACGCHAVREAGVGLQRPVLQKLDFLRPAGFERADLTVLAAHHEHRGVRL